MMRRRFDQEAQSTASLRSPHSVALYDYGVTEDGVFYYVLELLDGIDLETLVKKFGPQPPARVVHILRQVCLSLTEAHGRGMVHRDIKPTNILLCRMGSEYDRIIMMCLAKEQSHRPASAEVLSRMLVSSDDIGSWSAQDAEHWWRANIPGNAIPAGQIAKLSDESPSSFSTA